MAVCVRCHKDPGLVGAFRFNKQTGRCGPCSDAVNVALGRFRAAFLQFSADGLITNDEWQMLVGGSTQEGLHLAEALAFVRTDALHLLERTLSFAAADGDISPEEEQGIRQIQHNLQLADPLVQPLFTRMARIQHLAAIRRGQLPSIQPTVRLEAGEICHLEVAATYHKVNAKSVTPVPGRFVATNKKLHFLAPAGGAEIDWKKIMRVDRQAGGIYVELAVKKANGLYSVADPEMVEATLDTLVRLAKRELVVTTGDGPTRHIPQDIKQAVWQRDMGKCVQCADASYLEFDHIIPYSKGGANTVGNVQLLCRKCNLAKSDRI